MIMSRKVYFPRHWGLQRGNPFAALRSVFGCGASVEWNLVIQHMEPDLAYVRPSIQIFVIIKGIGVDSL